MANKRRKSGALLMVTALTGTAAGTMASNTVSAGFMSWIKNTTKTA